MAQTPLGIFSGFTNIDIASVAGYVVVFLCILLFGGVGILAFYYFWTKAKFTKKIVVFTKVGNKLQLVDKDLAMFQKVGNAGDQWCVTKKLKKVLPLPKMQMDKNTYWYFIRKDGEWVNFTLADLDEQMEKANAYFVDEDMRLQRLGIQRNLRDRLMKQSWWQKYGTQAIFAVFIIFTCVLMIVLFREFSTALSGAHSMAKAITEMSAQVANMANAVGGGVVPV